MMNALKKLTESLKVTKTATAEVNDHVAEFRGQLEALREEAERIRVLPASEEEIGAALDRGLARLIADARADLPVGSVIRSNSPSLPAMRPETMIGLMLAAIREQVRAILVDEIAERVGDAEGIAPETRAKKLAAITTQIRAVEMAEELLIREAERAGFEILRRADVDPDVLLMPDRALAA